MAYFPPPQPPMRLIPLDRPQINRNQLFMNKPTFYNEELKSNVVQELTADPRCPRVELLILPDEARVGDDLEFNVPAADEPIHKWWEIGLDYWTGARPWMLDEIQPGMRGLTFIIIAKSYLQVDPWGCKQRTFVKMVNGNVLVLVEPRDDPGVIAELSTFYSDVAQFELHGGGDFTIKLYYNRAQVTLELENGYLSSRAQFDRVYQNAPPPIVNEPAIEALEAMEYEDYFAEDSEGEEGEDGK